MPNTIPAAGEAMPETLEDLIARHDAALQAANICEGTLEGTPQEAELHAAVNAFYDSTAKLTSFGGVMDALRMAEKENRDFHGSIVSETLVKGALEFLEEREAEALWTKAKRLGKELSVVLKELGDTEFAFIRPSNNQFAVCFGGLPHDGEDPLLTAVNAFRDGCKAFAAIPGDFESDEEEEAAANRTYAAPLAVLDQWSQPALSREAVVASLELIMSENLATGYAPALLAACIPFIKGEMI